jgi:hypothetical protein
MPRIRGQCKLERREGIEPPLILALQASAFPICHRRKKMVLAGGVEPPCSPYESDILPLNYASIVCGAPYQS